MLEVTETQRHRELLIRGECYTSARVRAKAESGDCDCRGTAGGAARLARQFLHAEFHRLGGVRRHAADWRWRARSRVTSGSCAAGAGDERVVHETRERRWQAGGRGNSGRRLKTTAETQRARRTVQRIPQFRMMRIRNQV